MRRSVLLLIASIAAATMVAARAQQPVVQVSSIVIDSPAADSYVSGPSTIEATVTGLVLATRVLFFADGKQICVGLTPPYQCAWDAGSQISEHQIRVVAELGDGQRLVRTIRTKGLAYAQNVDVDVVQVTVTVTDEHGRFIKDLPKSAFHVEEDGRPQTLSHFAAEEVPLELVVAIDISGSMTAAMPRVKSAVKEFLGAVPARDQVTLLGFNDGIFTITRRTTDPGARVSAVDRLAPWGATALYDVILRGIEMVGRQTGRRTLVVFSDGEDQGSHASIVDVERRLQASDVTLYMIGQGRGVEVEALKQVMLRLTEPTGGRALFTDSPGELNNAFTALLEELSHQYLIGYEPTNAARDGTFRKIAVHVDGQSRVRSRLGYRASSAKK
jgi:VWFA-related protein